MLARKLTAWAGAAAGRRCFIGKINRDVRQEFVPLPAQSAQKSSPSSLFPSLVKLPFWDSFLLFCTADAPDACAMIQSSVSFISYSSSLSFVDLDTHCIAMKQNTISIIWVLYQTNPDKRSTYFLFFRADMDTVQTLHQSVPFGIGCAVRSFASI